MSKLMGKSLKNVGFLLFGTVFSIIIITVRKALILKYLEEETYGFFSIILGFLSIFSSLSLIGLTGVIPRDIAVYSEKKNTKMISLTMKTSLSFTLILNAIILGIILTIADQILLVFQNSLEFSLEFKIFLFSFPLLSIILLFIAFYRGFGNPNVKSYLEDIFRNAIFFVLIVIVVLLNLSFLTIAIFTFLSALITVAVILLYSKKNNDFKFDFKRPLFSYPVMKKTLKTSIPFFTADLTRTLLIWLDVFLVGLFLNNYAVAIFSVGKTFALNITFIYQAFAFIFVPVFAQVYISNKFKEQKNFFQLFSKWLVIATFPLFLLIFSFSREVILILSKEDYLNSIPLMQVAALGYLIESFLGMSVHGILVSNKTKQLIPPYVLGLILNILLNIFFIPYLGPIGASWTLVISLVFRDGYCCLVFYKMAKLQPFTRISLKLAVIVGIVTAYSSITNYYLFNGFLLRGTNFLISIGLMVILLVFTRCLEKDDINMISLLETKFKINLGMIKKILYRFVSHKESIEESNPH